MNAAEIIEELAKLSEADRRSIRNALIEIANRNPGIAACNDSALNGALFLDLTERDN